MSEMKKYNELINKKLELEENVIKINLQIEEAKTKFILTGILSDTIWFNKAKYALEMNKLELKKTNAEYELLKRTIKINKQKENLNYTKTFERIFIDTCKDLLTKEEYLKIIETTKSKINKFNNPIKINRSRWTLEEVNYLLENDKSVPIHEIASYLGRSEDAIKRKYKSMKKKNKEV